MSVTQSSETTSAETLPPALCRQCREPLADDHTPCAECDGCEECCDCKTCEGCERAVCEDDYCSVCDRCPECCNCRDCVRCDARTQRGNICSDCDSCIECCGCEDDSDEDEDEARPEPKVPFVARPPVFHTAKRTEFVRVASRRFLAVEIEVTDVRTDERTSDAVRRWNASVAEDGSLPDTGFEITTAPAQGDRFAAQVTEICDALNHDGANVDAVCGLHVHADARDFTYYDLRRLVMLYARVEPALFQMVPPARRIGSYCRPCGEIYLASVLASRAPKASKNNLIEVVYASDEHLLNAGERRKPPREVKYAHARYHALNLHSWFYRSTIEFRLHTGTTRAEKIIAWGKICAAILDAAHRMRERDIEAMPERPREALRAVVTDAEAREYIAQRIARFEQGGR